MINFASYSGRRRVSRDAGYSRMNLPFQALLATIQVSCLKIYIFPAVHFDILCTQ